MGGVQEGSGGGGRGKGDVCVFSFVKCQILLA